MSERHSILANAFSPGLEIDQPALFAGRAEQVGRLVDALHTDGVCPVIYGPRGLGKSSLAIQLQRIALGDVELLAHLGIPDRAFGESERFVAFNVNCSDASGDLRAVLQRVINETEEIAIGWQNELESERLRSRTRKTKFTAKVFETESIREFESLIAESEYTSLDLEERVVELARIITGVTGRRVVVVLDELDRVADLSGLASFVKSASSTELRFVLVGIAHNLAELIVDHESIERIAVPVEVKRMTEAELTEIITKATRRLELDGIDVEFSGTAVTRLSGVANGFPWFVHVIGRQALLDADAAGSSTVEIVYVERAIEDLLNNQLAQRFADMYQMAVRDSWNREVVLRCFAEWRGYDVPTGDVHRLAESIGVTNPAAYRGHLAQEKYGSVLATPPFQSRGVVRFSNEMFKVYVRLRDSIYDQVDVKVREAYERHRRQ